MRDILEEFINFYYVDVKREEGAQLKMILKFVNCIVE